MKKIQAVMMSTIILFSCHKNARLFEFQSKQLGDIAGLRPLRASPGGMMLVSAGKQFLLLDRSKDSLPENIYDRAIVLASENNFSDQPEKRKKFLGQSYCFDDERAVVVQSDDGRIYFLGLEEESMNAKFSAITQKIKGSESSIIPIKGYGLTLMKGRWDYNKSTGAEFNNAFEFLNFIYAGPFKNVGESLFMGRLPKCDSGGVGSESCSVKSSNPIGGVECSVKCKTGYYACCENSTTNCTCLKEPNVM